MFQKILSAYRRGRYSTPPITTSNQILKMVDLNFPNTSGISSTPNTEDKDIMAAASPNNNSGQDYKPTLFQMSMGLIIVGASAGMTLYTKKTKAMLDQMKRVEQTRQSRLPKKKFGPSTKENWDKMRNRWNDKNDEFL